MRQPYDKNLQDLNNFPWSNLMKLIQGKDVKAFLLNWLDSMAEAKLADGTTIEEAIANLRLIVEELDNEDILFSSQFKFIHDVLWWDPAYIAAKYDTEHSEATEYKRVTFNQDSSEGADKVTFFAVDFSSAMNSPGLTVSFEVRRSVTIDENGNQILVESGDASSLLSPELTSEWQSFSANLSPTMIVDAVSLAISQAGGNVSVVAGNVFEVRNFVVTKTDTSQNVSYTDLPVSTGPLTLETITEGPETNELSNLNGTQVQHLILTGTGEKPTKPTEGLKPGDTGWLATDILPAVWAWNITDDVWYYNNGTKIKKQNPGTTFSSQFKSINDVLWWDPPYVAAKYTSESYQVHTFTATKALNEHIYVPIVDVVLEGNRVKILEFEIRIAVDVDIYHSDGLIRIMKNETDGQLIQGDVIGDEFQKFTWNNAASLMDIDSLSFGLGGGVSSVDPNVNIGLGSVFEIKNVVITDSNDHTYSPVITPVSDFSATSKTIETKDILSGTQVQGLVLKGKGIKPTLPIAGLKPGDDGWKETDILPNVLVLNSTDDVFYYNNGSEIKTLGDNSLNMPVDVNTFSLEVSILNSVQYLSDYHQDKELSFEKGSCTYIGGIYYLITHTNGTKINFTDDFVVLKNDYSSFLPGEYLCKFTYLPNTNISVEVIGLNVIRNFGEFNDAIDSNIKFEVPISELSTDENLTFDFEIKSTSNSINPQVFWDISINYFFLGYTPSSNTILINGPSVKGNNEFPLSQIDQLADGQWHRITVSFPCSSKNSSYFLIDGVADEGFVSAPGLGATTWGVLVGSDFTLSFGAYATENKDIESFEGYMRNLKLTLGEKILIDCPNPANGENAGALNDGIVTNIK